MNAQTPPPVLRPQHPSARSLRALAAEFAVEALGPIDSVWITGVTLRTSEVEPGDLYVGMPGARTHGAAFAGQARATGAVAVLTDRAGAELARDSGLPILIVESPRATLGVLSAWVYRTRENTPLLFGVTGTNGKTSTSYILEAILRQLGFVTGLSSTAERHIGEVTVVSRLTTPEASEMHALLARMKECAVRAAVLEVSAQALDAGRVDGIRFDVVGFTNLSHDHLDDFGDMENYLRVKASLFTPHAGRRGVVLLDSPYGLRLADLARIPVTTVSATPGIPAEWNVDILEERAAHTRFTVTGSGGASLTSSVPLIGRHMAADAALAIVMLVEAGISLDAIDRALGNVGIATSIPGRTELVSGASDLAVYVDFGHSPDAFARTLEAVRKFTPGRVIVVCGADGDRDPTKRHEMGRVASEGADVLVVTDTHPRFEDPAPIRATLIEGAALARDQAHLIELSPPETAIRHAVSIATEGDSILWLGFGHQDYRDIRGVRTPFSARAEARSALQESGWTPAGTAFTVPEAVSRPGS